MCGHCSADVSGSPQGPCQVYDRVEIPPLVPEITRVSLHGGVCPSCARCFKACALAGFETGSPFGPNLRAFVIYLRFTQGVAFERLSRLMRDAFGLSISEGALVNILKSAREPFAAAGAAIRARLLQASVICSDETGLRVGKRSWWLWVFHHGQNASSSATSARKSGSPTAIAPRPVGPPKTSRPASLISCATPKRSLGFVVGWRDVARLRLVDRWRFPDKRAAWAPAKVVACMWIQRSLGNRDASRFRLILLRWRIAQ